LEVNDSERTYILAFFVRHVKVMKKKKKKEISPVTGLEWPGGFQEVKVPRFHDNGTGRW
jgi:hypothetical protein